MYNVQHIMYFTALIGNPTEHSVSHILYEALISAADLNIAYKHIKIDVEGSHLQAALDALKELKFAGVSVTLPYKLAVMPLLDEVTDEARELGAVNTIKFGHKTTGYNTDWQGIFTPISMLGNTTLKTATIFGTGGAARAAIYACKQLGIKDIYVLYRRNNEDEKLADLKSRQRELAITLSPYNNAAEQVAASDLIINATSAGMKEMDPVPFNLSLLDDVKLENKVFFEVVFNPLETPALRYFKDKGATTIDGLWMMIYQGIRALSIWLDQTIDVTQPQLNKIHELLTKELGNV